MTTEEEFENINFVGSKILMVSYNKYGITGMRIEDVDGNISNIVFGVSVIER